MKVGYIRVSTQEQNTARQEEILREQKADKIYLEKISGTKSERPKLKEMLSFIREGDTLIVESISRLARNTRDLLKIVDELSGKGVKFISLKETIDTNTPAGRFMLTVFGAISELEHSFIKQRQMEGIEIAKRQGKYKGRKPVDQEEAIKLFRLIDEGNMTTKRMAKVLNMNKAYLYHLRKKYRKEGLLPA